MFRHFISKALTAVGALSILGITALGVFVVVNGRAKLGPVFGFPSVASVTDAVVVFRYGPEGRSTAVLRDYHIEGCPGEAPVVFRLIAEGLSIRGNGSPVTANSAAKGVTFEGCL